jgi:DNA-damage-inducible protein J
MAAVNYTIRLEETDKKEAEQVFNQLGLTLAAGINVYLKAVGQRKKIPFTLEIMEKSPRMKLGEAFDAMQKQSVLNGTDNITMDDIDDIVADCRREERALNG